MKNKEITTTNQCKTKLNDIQCSLFITYENERSIEIFNFVHWFAENTNKMKIHKNFCVLFTFEFWNGGARTYFSVVKVSSVANLRCRRHKCYVFFFFGISRLSLLTNGYFGC